MARLMPGDVACWVFTTATPTPPGELTRCVRPSYRLGLMAAGQCRPSPCG